MYDSEYIWNEKLFKKRSLRKKKNTTDNSSDHSSHVCVSVLYPYKKPWLRWGITTSSPVIRSEAVTVEAAAINVETCSLDNVLCDHTQTVQHVAQLTKRKRKFMLIIAQENNRI